MKRVQITAIPNQSLSFNQDGNFWELRVYQAIDHMCIDIKRDGIALPSGKRCVEDTLLIINKYLRGDAGNFVFDSPPDWTRFGIDCNLYYLSADEAKQYEAAI